ncbi:MAG TPA: YfhO family protein [Caldilineae bacterium]|nr:YfhO family protein [Caldilineae bacterium]
MTVSAVRRETTSRWGRADALALLALTLAVVLVYSQVLLTNRTPASGDFLSYFTPYWDYVNEALRSGRLPLWNPFMYAGAPLLANPQAQVFYPLRWLFVAFPAEKGILYFAALHAWLAGAFTYALAKRVAGAGALAAFTAALVFALGGWTTGLLVQPVRWGTTPWLPAAILLWELRPAAPGRSRATRRWLILNILVWTLALLAGHSQAFYNQAVIFAMWIFGSIGWTMWRRRAAGSFSWQALWRELWPAVLALAVIFSLTLALAAVQLLPTLELTGQSYRSGGLPFREHAALSLPPWRLGFTLLPHYARDLGQALGSDAYGEWVAYVGVIGLLLALCGLFRGSRRIRFLALLLTVFGVSLALGAYNPLSYVLHRIVPGWNLFRVPARWLESAALGLALLAALGVENLWQGWRPSWRLHGFWRWLAVAGALVIVLALAALTTPNAITVIGWLAAILAFGIVLWGRGQVRRWGAILLVGLLLLEIYAASWTLPIQHPTAPQAIRSWRTAPARISAAHEPDCRTLSLSTTTYDPGDLGDLQRIYGPYLDERAFNDLVVATKAKEILAPNLGLLFRLPSLDGFGGGVLPMQRFVEAMALFLPPDRVVADGRLRETLREIPDARLLSLFGVCFVIADKQFDVWHDDVYYDLAFGEALTADQPQMTITAMPDFPATHVGLVSHLQGGAALPDGTPVAELVAKYRDGSEVRLPIRAGIETAVGADEMAGLQHNRDLPAVRWRFDAPGQDAIAQLALPEPGPLASIDLRLLATDVTLFVRGVAIIDRVSNAHATPPVTRHPWQRIHSGDVKIYENEAAFPRAFLVPNAELSPDDDLTLARMLDPAFAPAETALLAAGEARQGGGGTAAVQHASPEQYRIDYNAAAPSTLLIAEAWYPGWQATLDGQPVPIQRADLLLSAIAAPAGQHTVLMAFRPRSLRLGAGISLAVLGLLLLAWFWRGRRS